MDPAIVERKYDVAIVGSGAGGATLARELSLLGYNILVVEKGPLNTHIGSFGLVRNYFDVRGFPGFPRTSEEGVILWRALCAGGSTVVACGNAVRSLEAPLFSLGIDLSREFAEFEREIKVRNFPEEILSSTTQKIRETAQADGWNFEPMPKSIDFEKCRNCGNCTYGCVYGAKWDARSYLFEAKRHGALVLGSHTVQKVNIDGGKVSGVIAEGPKGERIFRADTVVLAAGGLATPVLLQQSGISDGSGLFLDLLVTTYGLAPFSDQLDEPPMSLVMKKDHENGGFLLSPFINRHPFTRFAEMGWKAFLQPQRRLMGLMTKISDESCGHVQLSGKVLKTVTKRDHERLEEGSAVARKILIGAGCSGRTIVTSRVQGAHPGGTAAIGSVVNTRLQTGIEGLYVCDASVLPQSPGLPPIMTIVALAKRLARILD